MKITNILIIFSLCFLIACSEERIDSSSEEKFKESIEKIAENTNELSEEDLSFLLQTAFLSEEDKLEIHGMTKEEAIRHLELKNKIKNIESEILSEENAIEDLQKRKQLLEQYKEENARAEKYLSNIDIAQPQFYRTDSGFLDHSIIDFWIRNRNNFTLKSIELHYKYQGVSREIPWNEGDFSYQFDGGLNSNESLHLQLSPNMLHNLYDQETKPNSIFYLTINEIEDVNGNISKKYDLDFEEEIKNIEKNIMVSRKKIENKKQELELLKGNK